MTEAGIKVFCEADKCTGCNACALSCPVGAVFVEKKLFSNRAIINTHKCIECGLCQKVCQAKNPPFLSSSIEWKEGWASDPVVRDSSASGGLAKAIMLHFLRKEWKVFCCVAKKDIFIYEEISMDKGIPFASGSFYVKSETADSFKNVKKYLLSGFHVLFIGLPCHVAGLVLYLRNTSLEKLLTIDIICHGTPSLPLFKLFTDECGVRSFNRISFRQKHQKTDVPHRFDYWDVPFLDGLTYTDNCYNCRFAAEERCSDVTLGDSWGTQRNAKEQNKGISLVIINSEKGKEAISEIEAQLFSVDQKRSIEKQGQLKKPASPHPARKRFATLLKRTLNYKKAVKKVYFFKILIARIKMIKPVYKIYRKIKPPKNQEFICFSVKEQE